MDIWMPEGGFFCVSDISRVPIEERFFREEGSNEILPRDSAFVNQ
jgi:hypothetical protein